MTGRWPYPGDLPSDRARQVALEYRRALQMIDPDACTVIDRAAAQAGETWVLDLPAIETEDDAVTIPRAAELVGRSNRWAYNLAQLQPEIVVARNPIKLRLRDVHAAVAHERSRRAQRAPERTELGPLRPQR